MSKPHQGTADGTPPKETAQEQEKRLLAESLHHKVDTAHHNLSWWVGSLLKTLEVEFADGSEFGNVRVRAAITGLKAAYEGDQKTHPHLEEHNPIQAIDDDMLDSEGNLLDAEGDEE